MHSESAREQLHAKWLPSGTNSLPSGLCQLSQVLKGARVIMCGQWKPLATSRAGPSQSRCSLGAGVLCQIMCRLNPEYTSWCCPVNGRYMMFFTCLVWSLTDGMVLSNRPHLLSFLTPKINMRLRLC